MRPSLSSIPSLPSLSSASLKLPKLGHRSHGGEVVGLDIEPGLIAAVKARVNGSILAERAIVQPLDADTVREGEVIDVDALTEALREMFASGGLGKRVRVGIANQRTVMRTLDLPPVTDRKELAAAVRFQAQDQVPMPLASAVLDFHPLGVIDTPAGPRQRVVLVAAQRDMVERLLGAVRRAGLTPEGVDLAAFALIRSLHDRTESGQGRVLYLNVDGLSNLAIAEGTVCRFTRVIGGGVEAMAGELAVRRSISLGEARALLETVDLASPATDGGALATRAPAAPVDEAVTAIEAALEQPKDPEEGPSTAEPAEELSAGGDLEAADPPMHDAEIAREQHEAHERELGYAEQLAAAREATVPPSEAAPERSEEDIRGVIESGVREIASEVRNSLDFHRTQDEGGDVSHVALSGAALDLPGFAEALQAALGIEVRKQVVGLVDASLQGKVSTNRLAVATGLAAAEAPR
jgi:type IV pilus assembly protein PilM